MNFKLKFTLNKTHRHYTLSFSVCVYEFQKYLLLYFALIYMSYPPIEKSTLVVFKISLTLSRSSFEGGFISFNS